MKTFLLLALSACMIGCKQVATVVDPQPHTEGPFTVVASNFDYHETLGSSDGTEFEFRHRSFEESLTDVGSSVEITFTGDLHSDDFDNRVIGVRFLKHSSGYILQHPELWPARTGHWDANSYLLDDGSHKICGYVQDDREIGEGWHGSAEYQIARDQFFTSFSDKAAAKKAVEDACK